MNMWEQVIEVIRYSQNIENPNIDELKEKWEQKAKWLEIVGFTKENNYILETEEEITINMDSTELSGIMAKFQSRLSFISQDLATFLDAISIEEFFNNRLKKEVIIANAGTELVTRIPTGTKVVKAFKYFIEDKDILTALQNQASLLIQQNKIKGKLCISINPLDYLSSSENTYNWRSCHSLNGQYRAGNLSYMADKSTLVCYIKGEKEEKLPHFPESVPWNSKKWRMLLHFSEGKDMMFAGRQYPFSCGVNILKHIHELLQKNYVFDNWTWTDWSNQYLEQWNGQGLNPHLLGNQGRELTTVYNLIEDPEEGPILHYNDLKYSTIYTAPYYSYKTNPHWDNHIEYFGSKFKIGAGIHCLKCGEHWIERDEGTMECDECWGDKVAIECDCCGEHFTDLRIEDFILFDNVLVCPECYKNYVKVCNKCGQPHWAHQGDTSLIDNQFYCYECLEDMKGGINNG